MKTRNKTTVGDDMKPAVRFVATFSSMAHAKAITTVADLDLDRLPDLNGNIRFLVSAGSLQRLLDQGIEVKLLAAIPIAPLNQSLIMTDNQSKKWFKDQVKDIRKKGGR